jgi:hypothetical protein
MVAFVYRIETFQEYGIDRNGNGQLSPGDDQVVKLGLNPKTGKYDTVLERRFLNPKVKSQIVKAIQADRAPPAEQVRVVYQRMPAENPPPVVIKEETSFGQHVKAGAGHAIGNMAVEAVGGILGSLFSGGGGRGVGR